MNTRIAQSCLIAAAIITMAGNISARISAGNIDAGDAVERVSVARDGRAYAWDRKGEILAGWPLDFSAEGLKVQPSPRLADVNRDGMQEIVLVLRSGSGAEQLRVLTGAAAELATWRFSFPEGEGAVSGAPLIADVNEDNRLELAYVTAGGKLRVYRHAAGFTKLDDFDADFSSVPWLLAADLDNDGRPWLFAVDAAGGEIKLWEPDGEQRTFASAAENSFKGGAATLDMDADGRPELVVGTAAPELLAYNRDGAIVARYPLPSQPAGRPLIADLDLDMEPDIIVLLADRSVYSVHCDGTGVRRWDWHLPYEAGGSLDTGIVAFDLYEGLISSISGWDTTTIYKVGRERFAELSLGENVHIYDRILAEMEMPITRIDEVVVQPKVITPNSDTYNDDAQLSYILSSDAAVTVEVEDAAGNPLYTVVENAQQHAGANTLQVRGVNTRGTATTADDESLPKGLYYLKLTAMNDLGLASRATTPLIVFGVRAQIDAPLDSDRADAVHPVVYGVVGISGIATDPNIGEGNDNFDFLAYKVYYRPGAWEVDEAAALAAGNAGSPWLPVPVPLQHQSPANVANEPADAAYPASNVGARPVQHGLLASWETTDAARTPNGLYTLLLKVVDGNGNAVGRVNFDALVVDLRNVAAGTPYDPEDPSTDPNDPENLGPQLSGVGASPATISTQSPESAISYTLANETSDITISIYRVANGGVGPVVASFAMGAQAPGTYIFSWNGKDNLNKRVDVGDYRARVTASAVDGTGGATATTSDIHMTVATEYNAGLAILGLALSSDLFDPFRLVDDGNGQAVQAEALTVSYTINRYAKVSIGVYDGDAALVRTLVDGKVDKIGSINWNGASDQGVIVPSGKDYTIRIKAECIDAGCTDVVEKEEAVAVRALSIGNGGIAADVSMLIGDGNDDGATPDEIAGILRDDDDLLNDFPLNGSSDFRWRAYGKGSIRVPFTYEITAEGQEVRREYETRQAVVTPENVPLTSVSAPGFSQGNPEFCQPFDFRLDPVHASLATLTFDAGFGLVGYTVTSAGVPDGISMRVESKYHQAQEVAAPFSLPVTPDDGASSLSVGVSLQGKPRGSGGISTANQSLIMNQCSHGTDLSLCSQLGYSRTPENSWYLMACWEVVPPSMLRDDPTTICGLWVDGVNPYTVAPITCGSVAIEATGKKESNYAWGPYGTAGNSILNSITQPAATWIANYGGATSSGDSHVISSWVTGYKLRFTPTINGAPQVRSGSPGPHDVGGIIRAWLGNASGPVFGGSLYVDILPDDFETTDDTNLSANTCVFNGGKFINGAYDATVQSASRRCILGDVKDINAQTFRLDSGPYSLHAAYPLADHPMLYTFSDVVHVSEWTLDLRYPDGTVNDAFDVTDMLVNPNGTRDMDGDGTPESNKNVNDSFKLKLKADAAPKRLIEVRGAVNGDTWELRYFEPATGAWQKIAEGQGAASGTIAWWDVSRLNGREYTVLLRALDDTGLVTSEDTMEVSIGTPVAANAEAVVTSPYRRYAIHFDEYSLCPEGGPVPCNAAINELVTVIPIPTDTLGLYLPSGIHPIGPIVEIKPDDIELNPTYQPQLEAYFTREEVEALYANDPQEVKDRVFGITANDPPVMAVYNLKDDGELEQLATINTWDDQGTPGTADDIFRISGMLNHFSRYILLREDDGTPRVAFGAPADGAVARGTVQVQGSVEGLAPTDTVVQLSITATPDGGSAQTIPVAPGASFDVAWTPGAQQGWHTIEAQARTQGGREARASLRLYVDNRAPVTHVVVNEQLVEPGSLAVVPPESQVMLVSEDAAERGSVVSEIRYRWDGDAPQLYQGLIPLAGLAPGRHTFSCRAKDDQGNEEAEQTVFITIVDPAQPGQGTGIATRLEIGEPNVSDGHQQWVGPTTPIAVVAADGSAPVYQIRYRLNDEDYQLFSAPVTLQGFEEGIYEIEFFGIDYYGLTEAVQSAPMVLDVTPPVTTVEIAGTHERSGGEVFIAAGTTFRCTAEDAGLIPAGLDRIEYAIDGGAWAPYAGPFSVSDPGTGNAQLEVRAVDRAGNAEPAQSFSLRFDAAAPTATLLSAPLAFSPNNDGVKDVANWRVRSDGAFGGTVRATLTVDGALARTVDAAAGEMTVAWDGRIGDQLASDGEHVWILTLADTRGIVAAPLAGAVIVDTQAPSVAVTGIAVQNGSAVIAYRVDDNIATQEAAAQLSILAGDALIASVPQTAALPPIERQISWGGINLSAATAFDGRYRYRLAVTDAAGNTSSAQSGELVLDRRPPASRLTLSGPSYDDGIVSWISAATRLVLSAADMAGPVDRIDYQLDAADWQRFAAAFGIDAAGAHALRHRAVDAAGNAEEPQQRTITVDLDPPASVLSVEGIQRTIDGKVHWSGSATFVKVSAVDQGSGVGSAAFEVTNPTITYDASRAVALGDIGDGEHAGRYWSVDRVANIETKRELNFVLHGQPPQVTLEIGLPQYRKTGALYIDRTTPLQAKALSNTPDIVALEYRIDAGAPVALTSGGAKQLVSPLFQIEDAGAHQVRYLAADDFENRRELAYPLTVDNQPPVTTIEKSQEAAGEEHLATPSTLLRLQAQDDIVGLKSTEYRIDAGPWQPYVQPFALRGLPAGEHAVSYRSADLLGHQEGAHQQLLELLLLDSSMTMTVMPRILMLSLPDEARPEIRPADLGDVRVVQDLCAERGWLFRAVSDLPEFLGAMRSDAFNVFAVASAGGSYHFEGTEFVDGMLRELAARVYNGDLAMLMPSAAAVEGVAWNLLWSRFGGLHAVPFEAGSQLLVPAGDDGELPTLAVTPTVRFEGTVEPIFRAGDATVVGKKSLGRGAALLVGVPPGAWAEALAAAAASEGSDPDEAWGSLWETVFDQALALEETPSPGEVVSFAIRVATRARAASAAATVSAPAHTALVGAGGEDLAQASAAWSADLPKNEEARFDYALRLPFDGSSIDIPLTVTTSWLNGLTDTTTAASRQEIGSDWRDQWSSCRSSISALSGDGATSDGGRALLQAILATWGGAEAADSLEMRIAASLDAFDKLAVLDAEKVAPLRADLARLVEALELEAYAATRGAASFSDAAIDSDSDGLADDVEAGAGTDPFDADSDDDGVMDGRETAALEDSDGDGLINALDPDSDNDGLKDGLEMGVVQAADDPDGVGPIKCTDEAADNLAVDSDPATVTNMTRADTDGGGLTDPQEDKNLNGRVDPGETDPNNPLDDTNPTGFAGGGAGGGCTLIPEARRD